MPTVSLKIMICSKRNTVNGFIFIDGAGPLPDDPEEFWVTEEADEDEPADDCACTGKLSRQRRGPLCSNFPCAVSLP